MKWADSAAGHRSKVTDAERRWHARLDAASRHVAPRSISSLSIEPIDRKLKGCAVWLYSKPVRFDPMLFGNERRAGLRGHICTVLNIWCRPKLIFSYIHVCNHAIIMFNSLFSILVCFHVSCLYVGLRLVCIMHTSMYILPMFCDVTDSPLLHWLIDWLIDLSIHSCENGIEIQNHK